MSSSVGCAAAVVTRQHLDKMLSYLTGHLAMTRVGQLQPHSDTAQSNLICKSALIRLCMCVCVHLHNN